MRIGVRFEPDWPPELLPEFARRVERPGFDELWFSEDLPWAGAFSMAAVALATTRRLHVGIGLLPATTRNAATMAMEVAALARIAPGRVTVGLGTGVPVWMRQIGAQAARPLHTLGEVVEDLRALLAGDTALEDVRLGYPPNQPVPLLLGTTGPRGLALAARVADGVILPEVTTPEAIRWSAGVIGDRRALVVFAFLDIGDDHEAALRTVRPRAQALIDLDAFPKLAEFAGLPGGVPDTLSDSALQRIAVVGTPAQGAAATGAFRAAGASCLVLVATGADPGAAIQRFADEVLATARSGALDT